MASVGDELSGLKAYPPSNYCPAMFLITNATQHMTEASLHSVDNCLIRSLSTADDECLRKHKRTLSVVSERMDGH